MATNVTAAAGQPLQSSPLGSVSGILQGGISNLSGAATNTLNKFFPPERRAALQARLTKFATEKPYLASFLLSQIALSGLPIALFAVFTVGVGVFALLVALIIAVLGAVLFTVFMAGVALLVLLPTLFITTFSAAFIWLWGVGLYYFIKWFNEKPVPGVHTSLKDGLMESTGLNAINSGFNDPFTDHKMPGPHEQDPSKRKIHQQPPSSTNQEDSQQKENQNSEQEEKQQKPRHQSQSKSKSSQQPLSEKKDGANAKAAAAGGGDLSKRASSGVAGVLS